MTRIVFATVVIILGYFAINLGVGSLQAYRAANTIHSIAMEQALNDKN